jgi:hypothetical protein
VFELVDALMNEEILAHMAAAFAEDPRGARALVERPRIGASIWRPFARSRKGRSGARSPST